jgi:hypothetical protein
LRAKGKKDLAHTLHEEKKQFFSQPDGKLQFIELRSKAQNDVARSV